MGKYTTPRVPIQTPMWDEHGNMTRTWIIFFERLKYADAAFQPAVGWDIQDAAPGLDVSDPVIPLRDAPIRQCLIRVKVTDPGNPLEIDVRNNGESIFEARPTLSPGANARTVHAFPTREVTIRVEDDPVIDIVQGGAWEFAAYLPYAE